MLRRLAKFIRPKIIIENRYIYFKYIFLTSFCLLLLVLATISFPINILIISISYNDHSNYVTFIDIISFCLSLVSLAFIKKNKIKIATILFIIIFIIIALSILLSFGYDNSLSIECLFLIIIVVSLLIDTKIVIPSNLLIIITYTLIALLNINMSSTKYFRLSLDIINISITTLFVSISVILLRNQTEKQIIEGDKKISEMDQLLNNIIKTSPVSIVVTENNLVKIWNDEAEKTFGWKMNKVINTNLQIIPQQKLEEYKELLKKIFSGDTLSIETERLTIDNRVISVLTSLSPLKNIDGKITGIIETFVDISKTKEIQKRKENFLSIASHELKTPITSLKIFNNILYKKIIQLNDLTSADLINKINIQIDKILKQVDLLLDTSKLQDGKLDLERVEFFIDELIIETVHNIKNIYPQSKINIDNNEHILINASRILLAQVLTNLLINAVKHSPSSPYVIINSIMLHERLLISIKDNGVGIERKYQKKIFERFYQVTKETSEGIRFGSGIGLYISYEIVHSHNGEIWVESEKNKGSTFFVRLPIK